MDPCMAEHPENDGKLKSSVEVLQKRFISATPQRGARNRGWSVALAGLSLPWAGFSTQEVSFAFV